MSITACREAVRANSLDGIWSSMALSFLDAAEAADIDVALSDAEIHAKLGAARTECALADSFLDRLPASPDAAVRMIGYLTGIYRGSVPGYLH